MIQAVALPLFKWPGGKRWLAPVITKVVSRSLAPKGTYFEPFAGGAAVFFALQPVRAVLSDVNAELIEGYETVRSKPDDVLRLLRRMRVSKEEYYRIRSSKPRSEVSRAARLLYLNRTAFGGMYRVNRSGEFNVPYGGGRTPSILWERDLLRLAGATLRRAKLLACDFETSMERAGAGDVIYCDPTYTVAHNNNGFVRYNERNFSWSDQQRLALAAHSAVSRGATVIVSNAHHAEITSLYPAWSARVVHRQSLVSSQPTARVQITECLFISNRSGQTADGRLS